MTEATTGGAYAKVSDEDPTWGGAPISFPRIQGADPVGEVIAVGSDVPEGYLGKRVMVDGWQRDWSDPHNLDKARYFEAEIDGGFSEFTS